MFTVKATYRNETRRFSFPDPVLFPTYDQLLHQLDRLFPISRNYYLSRLVFSPDAFKPGRILVGKEVHSAEDYDSYMAPLRRRWPNPLLRFTIFDQTGPQKTPSVSEMPSLYSTFPSSDATPKLPSPAAPPRSCVSPLDSQSPVLPCSPLQLSFLCTHQPPLSKRPPLPPPPIIFSPAPNESRLPHECGTVQTLPCCPIAEGKADIEILLSSFKEDLERILYRTLGPDHVAHKPTDASTRTVSGLDNIPPHADPPVSARPGVSRWCFVCRTSFAGVWYGCVKCPWHGVCPSCFSKSHSAHTLSFGPSHLVEQRSANCSFQAPVQITGETKPRGRMPGDSESLAFAPSSLARESPPVHRGIICDGCDKTIIGVRHKCLDCPDYDLCTPCVGSGATERHDPFHEFVDVETPGRVCVFTAQGGGNRSFRNDQLVSNSDHVQVGQGPVAAFTNPPVRHSATCNLCDSGIIGERYKCVVCPDYDTCSSCFGITIEQHPNHGFVKVIKPEDLMMRDSIPLRQVAHPAVCDSCRKTIRGARYKCMYPGCPDFDLCGDCEALPIPVHPPNHPMLKLKTPDTVIPTIYRTGQSGSAGELPSRNRASDCNESFPVLSPSPLRSTVKSPKTTLVAAGQAADTAEDQTPPAEEFLSPPGSPVRAEARTAVTLTRSQVVEPPKSPRSISPPLDIYYQLWPRVNQEMMHLNSMRVPKTEDLAVNVIEDSVTMPVFREPLATEATVPTTPATSEHSRSVSPVSGTKSIVSGYVTPPPMSSSAQEPHRVVQQLLDAGEQEIVMENALQQIPLDSDFVGDANVPEGQIFPPGAEFVKGWHMLNNGGLPWPPTTEIQFVAGETFASERVDGTALRAKVGFVSPGRVLDIWTGDLKAPDVPGRYLSYWRLSDGRGNLFGNTVKIDLTVVDHHSDQASEHPLAASSMVMPSAQAANSTSAGNELRNALQPSLPFTETAMDEIEDPESDASSVSLVSVPTSDDEDAEWQDTRTHSEPLEYVVLYDSNSEE